MTDNEIIMGLKHCANPESKCDDCMMYVPKDDDCECSRMLKLEAIALINRQKAEIESLI